MPVLSSMLLANKEFSFLYTNRHVLLYEINQCAKFMAEQAEGEILLRSLTGSLRTYLTAIFLSFVILILSELSSVHKSVQVLAFI